MHLTDLEPWVCTWCHPTHVCSHFYNDVVLSFIYTQCTWLTLNPEYVRDVIWPMCSHFYNNVVLSFIHTMHLTDLEPWVCTWCHLTDVFTFLQQCSVILYTHNAPDWPWTLSMYVLSSDPCMFTFLQQCSVILYTHTMHLTDLEPWVCTWCHLTHACSHFYNNVVLSSIHTQCTWLTLNPEYVRDVIQPMGFHISTTM